MKKIRINLDKLLKEHNLTQKRLGELAGVRAAAINEMVNNKRELVYLLHLEKIATVLDIDDINELLSLEDEKDK